MKIKNTPKSLAVLFLLLTPSTFLLALESGKRGTKRPRADLETKQINQAVEQDTVAQIDKKRRLEAEVTPAQESKEEATSEIKESAQAKLEQFKKTLQTLKTRIIADHNLDIQGQLNILDQNGRALPSILIPVIKRIIPEDTLMLVKGDLHGDTLAISHFKDNLIKSGKMTQDGKITDPKLRVIFLGDYIDRGKDSIQTLNLVTELKDKNPQQVYLLRGNHESSEFIQDTDQADTFGSQLKKLVEQSGGNKKLLNKLLLEFGRICTYMPQVFFAGYKHQQKTNFVAFQHAGIPTKTCPLIAADSPHQKQQAAGYTKLSETIKKLLEDETFINDSEIIQVALPCHTEIFVKEKKPLFHATSPFLWNDFLKSPKEKTRRATERGNDVNILAVGCKDTMQWLSDISSESVAVKLIVRSHQQGDRLPFMHPRYLGIWPACSGKVLTLDFSPRVPKFFTGHYKLAQAIKEKYAGKQLLNLGFPDTWLSIIPVPEKNNFRTNPLNRLVPPEELPEPYQKLTAEELYPLSLFLNEEAQQKKLTIKKPINQNKGTKNS
ncbi:MAG: hypothetical protein A2017_08955 [Lentisphaerae bacterium GWF2_44_16]|nr:MAG: hypothetical protein A2017_08955 [Lentisphaerae bacterium GWF2_44_16]